MSASDDSLPLELVEQLDRIADEFEIGLRSKQPMSIEDLLKREVALPADVVLRELLRIEVELRQAAGLACDESLYVSRFAEHQDIVRGVFAALRTRSDPRPEEVRPLEEVPARLGRYELIERLGSGGFGIVYLARDTELDRLVAVKVPRPDVVASEKRIETLVREARAAAKLQHPVLVTVHDVQVENNLPFVVYQYVRGEHLGTWVKRQQLDDVETVKLLIAIADALEYAHELGVVHCDLKLSNILVDTHGNPHVTDFGLSRSGEADQESQRVVSGTPEMMSPEQIDGEAAVDRRTDIWAMGVMLYELLVGTRPFQDEDRQLLFDKIKTEEPTDLQEVRTSVPAALSAICNQCLAKDVESRFQSAAELRMALQRWLDGEERLRGSRVAGASDVTITPRGLLEFDERDAPFYLRLLSGTRDVSGVPTTIRFWLEQIESSKKAGALRVGLVYGASGSGKSSLVRAGLIPHVDPAKVRVVYCRAAGDGFETELLGSLRGETVSPGDARTLGAVFHELAGREQGPKTVIVLDQFEQWLHSHGDEASQQDLVDALKHCNGDRLQVIIVVRDDFFASVNLFFQQLGIALREGENYTLIAPFSKNHARYVLEQFGYGYGCLTGELSDANCRFLDMAIDVLFKQGSVSGLHVAWFAEMMQASPWVPATLNRLGGLEGIGVAFLDERISSHRAAPHVRACEPQIRSALKLLIPPAGVSIRGRAQSVESLREAAGCGGGSAWARLLGILERELRLISPVETGTPSAAEPQYQLTHDYLVPSLRLWLSRREGETVQGRTQQKLEVMEEAWRVNPGLRYLPSFSEWLQIAWWAPRRTWTEGQRRLMSVASRYYLTRIAAVLASAVVLMLVLFFYGRRYYADGLVQRIFASEMSVLAELSSELQKSQGYVLPVLDQRLEQVAKDASARLKGDLATLWRERESDRRLERVLERIGEISVDDLPSVARLLRVRHLQAKQQLERLATESGGTDQNLLLRSISLLAGVAPSSGDEFGNYTEDTVLALVQQPRYTLALRPYREMLYPGLRKVFLNPEQQFDSYQVSTATTILLSYYGDDVERLRDLALDATPEQLERILRELKALSPDAEQLFAEFAVSEARPSWGDGWTGMEVNSSDIVAKLQQADGMLSEGFALCQTLPLQELDGLHEQLGKQDYQLVRLRPYHVRDQVLCAAVWRRGHASTEYRIGLTSGEVGELARELESGRVPIDVAGYVSSQHDANGTDDSMLAERYCLIWSDNIGGWKDTQVYVGVDELQQWTQESLLGKRNMRFCPAIQCYSTATGERKYCGIVCRTDSSSISMRNVSLSAFKGYKDFDRVHGDIDLELHAANECENDYAGMLLADWRANKGDHKNWIELEPMTSRAAAAMLQLGEREAAHKLCDKRLSHQPYDSATLAVKIELAAVDGDRQTVDELVERFIRLNMTEGKDRFLRATALAYFDAEGESLQQLWEWQEQQPSVDSSLLTARAFGRCAQVLAKQAVAGSEVEGDAEIASDASQLPSTKEDGDGTREAIEQRIERYEKTALDLLEVAIELGCDDWVQIERCAELSSLRSSVRYVELKEKAPAQFVVCGSRTTNSDFIEETLLALPLDEHLRQSQQLAAEGYRPVAVSVAAHPADKGAGMRAASIWHRPKIPPVVKRQAAVRQSNAAVAMLMLGRPQNVWPLLSQQPDPQVRTRVIHLLAGTGCPSDPLVERLGIEKDISRRRAMILALGEYDWEQIQDENLRQKLMDGFRDDPDPGIHAACWWTLERWGAKQEVDAIHRELVSDEPLGERRWFRDKLDLHTFVVFPGPVEFLAGNNRISPSDLVAESGHRRRIRRSFAVSMREVTSAQFGELPVATEVVRTMPRAVTWHPECSAGGVDWQMATIYCCMLNHRAGFPGRQWPTEVGDTSAPVRYRTRYLSRTGYRLPTAAEWEYAAKGGVNGNWFYGDSQEFSEKYAWSSNSAGNRSHPVGRLKPNDFGLFDILGNSAELMLQPSTGTYALGEVGDDLEFEESFVGLDDFQPGEEKWPLREPIWENRGIGSGTTITMRGGSFGSLSALCNATEVGTTRAHDRRTSLGFRVARTIDWSP